MDEHSSATENSLSTPFVSDILKGYPLIHGTFSRKGGVSSGPFASLNAGYSNGEDLATNVDENRRRIVQHFGLSTFNSLKQHHGKEVVEAEETTISFYADGLITDKPGIGLMILHADCQAAIIYDPKKHVLGTVHCGWRGHVLNIYAHTIEKMQQLYGSSPADLLVSISPSVGPTNFEFQSYETDLPAFFLPFRLPSSTHFDLWTLARYQLEQAGILPHHIDVACMCTYALSEDFFSFRRDKITGRNATVAALLSP